MNIVSESKPKFESPIAEETAQKRADSIVALMSTDEKLDLIKGHNGFFIKGFEKYGMPDIYLTDASQGVHIRESFLGSDLSEYALPKSVAFPNTLCLAATWNPKIARTYAKSIGEECKAAGIGVLLGPGMNIYRNSQNGRNFEYMGEDPYLAARMVEQYIVGVQNTGVIATLKHFVANNTDYRRRASNTIVDERTLHEIYMPAFKSGVDAGALAVMTSYNLINGEWAGQNDFVINYLLREKLGFSGLVMSDWWSINDCKALVNSGQDLEMPGGESMANLKSYVEKGEVDIKKIDKMCGRIIKTLAQMGYLDGPIKDTTYLEKFEVHEQVALKTAREGIVLLRNENNVLPISKDSNKKILLTGIYIDEVIYGGGSGEVKGYNKVTMLDALQKVYPNLEYKPEATEDDLKNADVVIVSVGTWDWEGCDRRFALTTEQEELVQKASTLNANTMVVVNSGSGIRMSDWNNVKAIVYNWYPGQIGNVALAEILTGITNPSGKLPMSIEKEFKDSPAYGYVSEDTAFLSDHEKYLDTSIPESELNRWSFDTSIDEAKDLLYNVEYKEGVLVGYRWYDTKKIAPLFPFGYGLSYTTFALGNIKLSSNEIAKTETLKVTVEVANTGKVDGATTVQLYVGEQNATVTRPVKELKAFQKVWLKAGEKKQVDLYLTPESFSYWSADTRDWEINAGKFTVFAGQSSANIEAETVVTVH
ncbi:glycoside hydrolase family 3 protein [uncultured Kordia sp.]|uniref:beta-glucosidase n=1 Tax=uncultured Kordia sp. TaxID=507699 RepID=UPI00261FD4EA|nr:glycoside hydrolase family 3 C-terminal domain-containing protein [uncultured Kordia sp.]